MGKAIAKILLGALAVAAVLWVAHKLPMAPTCEWLAEWSLCKPKVMRAP